MDFTQKNKTISDNIRNIMNFEALPGILLVIATLFALIIANSPLKEEYHHLFSEVYLFGSFNLHVLVNDFLMSIFFLVVGCEIKKELINGHLSNLKKASFPIVAAIGGVILPATIFFLLNKDSGFSNGVGIPISTDIAFAIGAFMIFRKKLNSSLKIFLLTLAVVDDLMSILIIGVFYSSSIKIVPLIIATAIFILLLSMKSMLKVEKLYPYFIFGFFLWIFIFFSGIHATISGVLLAFAIPIRRCDEVKCECLLSKVQYKLSPYANLLILPLFAFLNTAINLHITGITSDSITLILGIIIGLVIGKPLGIMLFTYIGVKLGLLEKPNGVTWYNICCVSMLAGIGFTMSIFVSEIALESNMVALSLAKVSILIAAIISCTLAFLSINILPNLFKKLAK